MTADDEMTVKLIVGEAILEERRKVKAYIDSKFVTPVEALREYLTTRFPCGNMLCGAAGRCCCNDPAPRPKDQMKGSNQHE